MRDEQTVQSDHSQKGPEDVVKLLTGADEDYVVSLQREGFVARQQSQDYSAVVAHAELDSPVSF